MTALWTRTGVSRIDGVHKDGALIVVPALARLRVNLEWAAINLAAVSRRIAYAPCLGPGNRVVLGQ